ncbi:hypothetical protein SAMN05421858_1112 [Haladaptatus litoreus]|uniref:Uncharacterized protein n=1 Tax=Haladaptatus litoreus TaxID=553468 RepID=A0A1N6XFL0_9EURY|nr:DUF5798 family protein [Haladaptatus litoreus]SIR01039.1 hypothetical protein SAMN05421858_1112 [Haladaptatus litoreus]
MGLGNTAKKIQKVADTAEKLYAKLNELREQVLAIRDSLEDTDERVQKLEVENAEQKALIEALAREQGIDVESVLEDVETPENVEEDVAGDEAGGQTEDGTKDESPQAST